MLGNQRGDTLVEVLIAMAIVSLVLAGAYVSTTRNIRATQNTQEHSQALQLVQGQIELLRDKGAPTAGNSCFDLATSNPTNSCTLNADGTLDTSGVEPAFHLAITAAAGGVYKISATWASLEGSNQNDVTLYYRPAN